MRKTKIVCTIGPACGNKETLKEMCLAGMNVARLNFSHGTHESHAEMIALLKEVRRELNRPLAIMLDTKGPEVRIKTFRDGKVTLTPGQLFTFTVKDRIGDETGVSVTYPNLIRDLKPGDTVLLNNGLLRFTVRELNDFDAV